MVAAVMAMPAGRAMAVGRAMATGMAVAVQEAAAWVAPPPEACACSNKWSRNRFFRSHTRIGPRRGGGGSKRRRCRKRTGRDRHAYGSYPSIPDPREAAAWEGRAEAETTAARMEVEAAAAATATAREAQAEPAEATVLAEQEARAA